MNPEVVVVGAGAAGVGAGLELTARGVPFVILEASGRVGGRAFTDKASLPHPWDQGCHWLHCADVNPLVEWADRLGADYDRQERINHFMIWSDGRWVDDDTLATARGTLLSGFDAVYEAAEGGRDVPISSVLPQAGRWQRATRYILQVMASEDPELVSTLGYADYDDTDKNWPVHTGYGDLIERMAIGLPIRLNQAVTGVEQRSAGVRVRTAGGTIDAKAAVITVSTNVLRSGAIAFGAGPARELLDPMQEVPCGSYEKVALAFDRSPVDDAGKLFCMVDAGDGGSPLDFQVARPDRAMMIAHMAGSLARDLAREGEAAMVDFALERLAAAFGADIRKRVVKAAVTGWQRNPFVRGGYSYAKPGSAQRRHAMIAADSGNVAFAGEAFSTRWQATAHGAYQSGRDRAAGLVDALGLAGRGPRDGRP